MRSWRRITIGGVGFDPLTESEVVTYVRTSLDRSAGGRLLILDVDVLRRVAADPLLRADCGDADLVVADGRPMVWASRLAGTPLPGRVAAADLILTLSAGLAHDQRSVYLLGGQSELGGRPAGAERAAAIVSFACPGLAVAGYASPRADLDTDPAGLADLHAEIIEAKPDVVFTGVGGPTRHRLFADLRGDLPGTWFVGCGAAIERLVGDRSRFQPPQHPGYALRLLTGATLARRANRRARRR